MGPKGKMPWITLNGEEYTDSTLIIELLSKKFQKDLTSHLSAEEKAVGRAFQIMTEEHLYWWTNHLNGSSFLYLTNYNPNYFINAGWDYYDDMFIPKEGH